MIMPFTLSLYILIVQYIETKLSYNILHKTTITCDFADGFVIFFTLSNNNNYFCNIETLKANGIYLIVEAYTIKKKKIKKMKFTTPSKKTLFLLYFYN